jgi:hypothetical protein
MRAWPPAEYRRLLGENGFEVVSHVAEEAASGGRTIWLAQLNGPDPARL